MNPTWIRLWRRLRKRRGYREHALREVEVQGIQHVENAIAREGGVLITPNHPSHADPFVLLEAADRLTTPLYFMAAWQVFAGTHTLGRRILRQHGCFSVNREGHDVRAVRQAVRLLEEDTAPLVIFPEGEVYHLNDRVTPFRDGAVQTAAWAAHRSRATVSVIPCAIKLQFVEDPFPQLHQDMSRLEAEVGCPTLDAWPLAERVCRFGEFMLGEKERQVIGRPGSGRLGARVRHLIECLLRPLERRYDLAGPEAIVPERVKRLRQRIVCQLDTPQLHRAVSADQLRRDLDHVFTATQLYSYRIDYLAGDPPVERLAETVEKFTEDLFGVRRAKPPAKRRAIVRFAAPLMITPASKSRATVKALTADLQDRVQCTIDQINAPLASPRPTDRLGVGLQFNHDRSVEEAVTAHQGPLHAAAVHG